MKKTEIRKLSLNRETVMPLQDAELDHVHGGTLSAVVRASRATCSQALRWVSKQVSISVAIESAAESVRRTASNGQ
jgi:hypothetical protein